MIPSRLIHLVLFLALTAPATAQLAERGNWALGLALPTNDTSSFSLWKVQSPKTLLGLDIRLSWNYGARDSSTPDRDRPTVESHTLGLQVRPTLRRYYPLRDKIAPFTFYQLHIGFTGRKDDSASGDSQSTSTTTTAGLSLGIGADWFPFQRFSLGAQTGLTFAYLHTRSDTRPERNSSSRWSTVLQTFKSEVNGRIYF
ncbi:MAG: hypothetical protein GKR89_20485 [Candidatus Latescibacteria bacterium]|nr:hypothetical protein [Candidatus Latescibacterota bacterium]